MLTKTECIDTYFILVKSAQEIESFRKDLCKALNITCDYIERFDIVLDNLSCLASKVVNDFCDNKWIIDENFEDVTFEAFYLLASKETSITKEEVKNLLNSFISEEKY